MFTLDDRRAARWRSHCSDTYVALVVLKPMLCKSSFSVLLVFHPHLKSSFQRLTVGLWTVSSCPLFVLHCATSENVPASIKALMSLDVCDSKGQFPSPHLKLRECNQCFLFVTYDVSHLNPFALNGDSHLLTSQICRCTCRLHRDRAAVSEGSGD